MTSIRMSNDGSLIYVLVSLVYHNVNFRHFGGLKMQFLIIRQRVPTFGNRCSLRSKLVFSIHHAIVDISHHNTNINFQISKLFTMLFDWAKGLISGYPMFGLGNYENEHNETLNKRFL